MRAPNANTINRASVPSFRCRVVLVGDPKQLPATVKSLVAQKLSLARSLFERLQVRLLMSDVCTSPYGLQCTACHLHEHSSLSISLPDVRITSSGH